MLISAAAHAHPRASREPGFKLQFKLRHWPHGTLIVAFRWWAKSQNRNNAESQQSNNAESQESQNRIRGAEDRASESRLSETPETESQRKDSKTRKHYSNTKRNPLLLQRRTAYAGSSTR
jgi:hypothetical protein